MAHWFDELGKRIAKRDEQRRPSATFASSRGATHGAAKGTLLSRRSLITGASAAAVGAVAAGGPFRLFPVGLAMARRDPCLANPGFCTGNCPEEVACKKAAITDALDYIKDACSSPFAGFSGYTDGEDGNKLGCVVQANIVMNRRVASCECICCPHGLSKCGKCTCVDLQNDDNNCGSCGHACISSSTCINGHCSCNTCGDAGKNPYSQVCGGQCVDTAADPTNCGSCGNVCPDTVNGFTGICNCGVCDGCSGAIGGFWCCQTGKCTHACPQPGETCP